MRFTVSMRHTVAIVALLASVFGIGLATAGPAQASSLQFQLDPGDSLRFGQGLWSADGRFLAHMDHDGNFVVKVAASGNIYAMTSTSGYPDAIIRMQEDGNLVVIAPGNVPVWASGTDGYPGTVLQIQDDGALVLYAPGHKALKVVVPRLFDAENSVPTPRLQPYGGSPSGTDLHDELRDYAVDGGKAIYCSTYGKVVEESGKVPHGKVVSIAAEQACSAAAKGEVPKMNGYDATVLITSIVLGPVGPAFELFFGDPPPAY